MNTAIIVAAGSGSRLSSETPKQFLQISGKPIIFHTLERFENCGAVDEIVLVLAPGELDRFGSLNGRNEFSKVVRIVEGGSTRAESVRNGLVAVSPQTSIVAVHDGARPLVTEEEISITIKKAEEVGAACLVAAVVDSTKEVSNGVIVRTLDRSRLRRALTPQAFKYDILVKAFDAADLTEAVTDECFLVEKLGVPIALVEGSSRNIKITHPDDLALAEVFLKARH